MDRELDIAMMRHAIELSKQSLENDGGPFGAVIVKDGHVIGEASNHVTLDNDPTAHAEVSAIRNACKNIGSFDLTGSTIYCSCEPCPMCFGAIYWAHISRIVYANSTADAAKIGFDDGFIYKELSKIAPDREVAMERLLADEAIEAFRIWENKSDKAEY